MGRRLISAVLSSIACWPIAANAQLTITPKQENEPAISITLQNDAEAQAATSQQVETNAVQDANANQVVATTPDTTIAQPMAKAPSAEVVSKPSHSGRDQAIVVLDGSGSMWGLIDEVSKIEIARDVVSDVLQDWPDNTELGLMSYGHREKGNCSDIETLITPGTVDTKAFRTAISNIQPKGKTPMSEAVIQAAKSLKYTENKATVILISDGEETCGLDPCAVGRELEAAGVDFTTHVIGFDIANDNTGGLRCLAETTGGQFLRADNADELKTSLRESVVAVAAPAVTITTTPSSIAVTNVTNTTVGICSASSECYNSASPGWVGELSADVPSMQVLPGDYKLKVGNYHQGTIAVSAGERVEVAFGRIKTDRLGSQVIGICDFGSECFNSASPGWAGELSSAKRFIELPAGQYQAKILSHVSDAITVSPGKPSNLELSELSVQQPLLQQSIAVCANGSECYNSVSDGWLGELTAAQPSLYLFSGDYQLKFGNHFSAPFNAYKGQDILYTLGQVSADVTDQPVSLCAQYSECYNSASVGWLGELTAHQPGLLVPEGQYKLKLGNSFSAPVTVQLKQPEASAADDLAQALKQADNLETDSGKPQPIASFKDCDQCPEMVTVPLSTDAGATQFAIGKYEVTRDEFAYFANETGHPSKPCILQDPVKMKKMFSDFLNDKFIPSSAAYEAGSSWQDPGFEQTGSHPVVCVNLDDATDYVEWLSAHTGQTYRLPTEIQWTTAAMTDSPQQLPQIDLSQGWTNCDEAVCNDGYVHTSPVGSFDANAYGVHDIYGNVIEWLDNFSPPAVAPPKEGLNALIGGGAYNSQFRTIDQACGIYDISHLSRNRSIGFRVVKAL